MNPFLFFINPDTKGKIFIYLPIINSYFHFHFLLIWGTILLLDWSATVDSISFAIGRQRARSTTSPCLEFRINFHGNIWTMGPIDRGYNGFVKRGQSFSIVRADSQITLVGVARTSMWNGAARCRAIQIEIPWKGVGSIGYDASCRDGDPLFQ